MFRQKFDERPASKTADAPSAAKDFKYYGRVGFVVPNPSLILFLYQPTQKFVELVDALIESKLDIWIFTK